MEDSCVTRLFNACFFDLVNIIWITSTVSSYGYTVLIDKDVVRCGYGLSRSLEEKQKIMKMLG
jgi:hypothetical protein